MAATIRLTRSFRLVGNTLLRSHLSQHVRNDLIFNKSSFVPLQKVASADYSRRLLTTSIRRLEDAEDVETIGEPAEVHVLAQEKVTRRLELSEAELQQAIEYLTSEEYVERYGQNPVWANYKRNHKGRVAPMNTRKTCVRGHGGKRRVCGNPCPICRDSNLIIHYKNVKLLEQFICPHSWDIYSTDRTGVCRKQYKLLLETIEKARRNGLLPFQVPFISYQYEDFYSSEAISDKQEKTAAEN